MGIDSGALRVIYRKSLFQVKLIISIIFFLAGTQGFEIFSWRSFFAFRVSLLILRFSTRSFCNSFCSDLDIFLTGGFCGAIFFLRTGYRDSLNSRKVFGLSVVLQYSLYLSFRATVFKVLLKETLFSSLVISFWYNPTPCAFCLFIFSPIIHHYQEYYNKDNPKASHFFSINLAIDSKNSWNLSLEI